MYHKTAVWLLCAALIAGPSLRAEEVLPPVSSKVMLVANARVLTLDMALDRAIANSPQLKAARAATDASKGAQAKAGALPNPELDVEAENIGGQGEYTGVRSAEITYGVSQLVEIGGKRAARQAAADQEHVIAHAEYEAARLDLIRDVKAAYAEAVAAKEGVALAEKHKSLAAEVLKNVSKRVDAAAEPLFQKSKSEVALSNSEMALDKARRDYTIARTRLAAMWESTSIDFEPDSSGFFEISAPSQASIGEERLAASPDIARWNAEVARNEAQLELEQITPLPDPRFSVGMKELRATNDRAFVVGVSFPIPVFDMNSGNVAKARGEVAKATSQKRFAQITLNNDLSRSQQELESAYRQASILKTHIIPSADKAYRLSRQGYDAGKFAYLEVLDAQRTLVEARAQYNDTLRNYHAKRAEVERLLATYTPAAGEKDDSHAN